MYACTQAAGLKQLGLPLSQRDIVKMVHKSLSGAAEQNVHFRSVYRDVSGCRSRLLTSDPLQRGF
eukprot:1159633-Pelagomonas_calceolata.AAC.4